MTKLQRKNGDNTRKKIIQAASHCFAKMGFSGTPMQRIADKANINQALLYHHFKNKKMLWKTVKQHYVEKSSFQPIPVSNNLTLESVLSNIVEQSYELYTQSPKLVRMLLWQQLEANEDGLMGGNSASPDQWLEVLDTLQQQNKIRQDMDIQMIMIWIASSLSGIALLKLSRFKKDKSVYSNYKEMLLIEFINLLHP